MVGSVKKRDTIEKRLDEIISTLQDVASYIDKDVVGDENEVMGVLFALPDEKEIISEKIEKMFSKKEFSIVVLSLRIQDFIYKFVKEYKTTNNNLKIGEEISELDQDGIAVYINWTNNGMILHKYRNGKFLSESCKKIPAWKTSNGVWVVGFKDEKEAKKFTDSLKKELYKHYNKNYSINYHKLCMEIL